MSKRPDRTLFLLTLERVVRADFARSRGEAEPLIATAARPADSGPADAVSVLFGNRRLGSHCWILDTSLWSQLVEVPRLSVMDVSPEELANALKFEVETLTGLESEDSVLGFCPLEDRGPSDQQAFWIHAGRKSEFEALNQRLQAAGARHAAWLHPAGIVGDRLSLGYEVWDGQIYVFQQGRLENVVPASAEGVQRLGFDSLDQLQGAASCWVSDQRLEEQTLSSWLGQVDRAVQDAGTESFPVIRKGGRNAGGLFSRAATRIFAALAVAALCFVHWNWLNERSISIADRIRELKEPGELKREFDSELARILEERAKLEADSSSIQLQVKQVEFLVRWQTDRYAKLLELLRESRTKDLVIREIVPNELGLLVKGFSLTGSSVALMANSMRDDAIPLGWLIQTPAQVGEKKMVSGGPWQFSIQFEDIGPGQPQASASTQEVPKRNNTSL